MCTDEGLNLLLEIAVVVGDSDVKFEVAVIEKVY